MCKIKTSYRKTTYTRKTVPQWKSLSSEKCIGEIKWLYSNQGEWTEGRVNTMNFSGYLQFKSPPNKGCRFLYIHINIYIFQKYYSTSCKIRITLFHQLNGYVFSKILLFWYCIISSACNIFALLIMNIRPFCKCG